MLNANVCLAIKCYAPVGVLIFFHLLLIYWALLMFSFITKIGKSATSTTCSVYVYVRECIDMYVHAWMHGCVYVCVRVQGSSLLDWLYTPQLITANEPWWLEKLNRSCHEAAESHCTRCASSMSHHHRHAHWRIHSLQGSTWIWYMFWLWGVVQT